MNPIWSVLGVFSLLSILAIGGGTAVLPEMKSVTVDQYQWLTDAQFVDIYSIGQLIPGPNMLMVMVIGYKVAGLMGALAAFVGFFMPAALISWGTTRVWDHFDGSPWRASLQLGMAPIVIGLMAAGTIAVARTALANTTAMAIAAIVFVVLYFGKKVSPALLILAGGIMGWFFLK